nr:hypothetical protein [uncultured Flavobacterium sp.]
MNTESESHFEEFEKPLIIRRKLLPWWIKTFCWIFMVMGVCAIGVLIASPFITTFQLSIYGFETNTPLSGIGLFIIAILIFKGFAAYSLWFEKDNAMSITKIDAILGVVICIISMFIIPFISESSHFSIRLELALLIPYYLKLNKIEYEWDNLESL